MFITDGHNIRLPRGDSAYIKFTLLCEDGETPYMLGAGDTLRFGVFPVRGAADVIAKTADRTAQSPDGALTFALTREDTDIPAGVYRYALKLAGEGGCDTLLGFPDEACFAVGTDCEAYRGSAPEGEIKVTVSRGGGELPPYPGEYTVSPSFNGDTVLETAGRSLLDNITVESVPVTRTENSAGGITLTIGGQT